jgi:uncharacterized protein CbrC (UPF0167 family)
MSFADDLAKFVDKANANVNQAVKETTKEIARKVVERTPADTGLAKANWQFGDGNIPASKLDAKDPSGAATVAKLEGEIDQSQSDVLYLANNADHIVALEYGHSKKRPNGMVRVTLAESRQTVSKAVEKVKK